MMKRKTKTTLKSIIATALSAAITLTGISFNSTTVKADITNDMTNIKELNETTITMKPGETKEIVVRWQSGLNATEGYAWASSDENVVIMDRMWFESPAECLKLYYVEIEAAKAGTSVITAADNRNHEYLSFTVNVEEPKKTAKQLKCKKHAWKTTKKATCSRTGVKTCKKCKLQKVTSRKQHDYETVCEERYEYTYAMAYVCGGCTCGDPSHVGSFSCPKACWETFDQREYGSREAAEQAWYDHQNECKHTTYGNWL